MAEASDDADVALVCSLCLEQFVNPRKLPDCGHCFCKACLITYMTKLNDNKELENKLKCPVCTKYYTISEEIGIKEWVMMLETDCAKGQRHGRRDQDKCASCKSLGRESKPTVFCLDCIKSLCHGCSEIRHTYEPIQHHKCIDIEKTFKNGDEAEKISMLSEYLDLSCDSHPNKAMNYCCNLDNKVICCSACGLTDHKMCNSVFTINKLVEAEGMKKKKEHMAQLISQLSKYVETVVSKVESCATNYKKQIEEIARKIKEIRAKINQIMDSLEEALNDQAKAMVKQHVLMTTEVIDGLKEMAGNLRVYEGLTETIETCGSQIHQYIVTSKIIGKIKDQESAILDTTRAFRFTELSLKPQSPLLEILQIGLNDTHNLAYVEEQTSYNYSLPAYEVASLLEYDKITKTCDKCVQGNYKGGNEPTYDSLVYLPNGDFVLIDTYKDEGQCILTKGDGTVLASRDFKYCSDTSTGSRKPYCATVIKNGEIAVSIPDKKKICIISADKQLKSTFTGSTKYKPKAIHGLPTGDIAVAFDDPVAFGIITFDDIPEPTEKIRVYFSHDKEGRELKNFDYMAIDENRSHVIQPCLTDRAVYCFDFNGNPKFKYKGKDNIFPRGVAVDGYGSIFVCDYNNYEIHVISPAGNAVRVIQKSEGCPESPLAIGFKKNGEEFAVTKNCSPWHQVTFFGFQKPS